MGIIVYPVFSVGQLTASNMESPFTYFPTRSFHYKHSSLHSFSLVSHFPRNALFLVEIAPFWRDG